MSYDIFCYKSKLGKPNIDEVIEVIDLDHDKWIKKDIDYEKKFAIEKALINFDSPLGRKLLPCLFFKVYLSSNLKGNLVPNKPLNKGSDNRNFRQKGTIYPLLSFTHKTFSMRPIKAAIVIILLILQVSQVALSAGVPSTFKTKDQNLILNGSGVRNKCWIDLFTGALYLKKKSNDASHIVNANEVMAIKIEVTSNVITSKRLEDNMRSEFKRVTNGNIAPYKDRIENLVKAFREDVKIGDTYDLIYNPKEGLKIYKNTQLKSHILGLDFKRMLFSIWLGEDPADKNLKNGMLGIGS